MTILIIIYQFLACSNQGDRMGMHSRDYNCTVFGGRDLRKRPLIVRLLKCVRSTIDPAFSGQLLVVDILFIFAL